MAYIGATDLNSFLPSSLHITASSMPGTDSIDQTITDISAELNAAAAKSGYTVPVATSAPNAYALMQLYAKYGVAWLALKVQMPNQARGSGRDTLTLADEYREAYRMALSELASGALTLIDDPPSPEGPGHLLPRSYAISNPGGTGISPRVSVTKQF